MKQSTTFEEQWWRALGASFANSKTLRGFRALFGLHPKTVANIWRDYFESPPVPFSRVHFLWALAFLRLYDPLDSLHTRFCGSRENFSDYVWLVLRTINQRLPNVSQLVQPCNFLHSLNPIPLLFSSLLHLTLLFSSVSTRRSTPDFGA
jgi:hypothetical protein